MVLMLQVSRHQWNWFSSYDYLVRMTFNILSKNLKVMWL